VQHRRGDPLFFFALEISSSGSRKVMETLNEKQGKKLKESFDLSVPFTLREYIPAIEEIIRCVFITIFCISLQKDAKKFLANCYLKVSRKGADTNLKGENFCRKTSLPSIAGEIKKKFPFCIFLKCFPAESFVEVVLKSP
jgi:hypothetical protein